jgi:translation initiation factor 4E
MEASNNFLNSLNLILKKNASSNQNENSTNEVTSGETPKETKIQKIPTNPEEKAENPSNNPLKKEKLPDEEIEKNKSSIIVSINNSSPSKDKNEIEEKPKENIQPKENNAVLPKEEKTNINIINIISNNKKEEKEKVKENDQQTTHKEKNVKNKDDYIFPIPNNNSKIEETKNQDSSFFLYKKPQNNFGSLNLDIPDNLRPKNKESQAQAQIPNINQIHNHQIYNMSYFNPITFSCSLNTHSVKKSRMKPIEKEEDFLEKIIKIADVSNINEFWEVFQHLKKPNQCPVGSDYHIFKKGIVPMWEDKLNKDGGKLSMLLTWKYANVIWEEVTFNFAKGLLPYYDYINGIVISVRPKFLALSFWIRCGNNSMVEKIKNALSGLLQAPSTNCFDFIPFN